MIGVDADDERVARAELHRQQFVMESEVKFSQQDVDRDEEEEREAEREAERETSEYFLDSDLSSD